MKTTVQIFIATLSIILFPALSAQASTVSGTLHTGVGAGIENGVVISAPTANPGTGTYTELQSVVLSAPGATSVRYTHDGTTPVCAESGSSVTYHVAIPVSETTTLKAIACYPNGQTSTVSTFEYIFEITQGDDTGDTVKPIITLLGNATVNISVGATYVDQGATSTDNVDGDITSSIVTTSNVNTSVAGTYIVKYNVTDTAGNTAIEIARTVTVTAPAPSGGGGGGGGGGGTLPPTTQTVGDLNHDTKVNKYDFALMMSNWGKTGSNISDLNSDGVVNKYDFALMMAHWNT